MSIKVDDKVKLKIVQSDFKGKGFENSVVKKIWVGSCTGKTWYVIESYKGHIMSQVDEKDLELIK